MNKQNQAPVKISVFIGVEEKHDIGPMTLQLNQPRGNTRNF